MAPFRTSSFIVLAGIQNLSSISAPGWRIYTPWTYSPCCSISLCGRYSRNVRRTPWRNDCNILCQYLHLHYLLNRAVGVFCLPNGVFEFEKLYSSWIWSELQAGSPAFGTLFLCKGNPFLIVQFLLPGQSQQSELPDRNRLHSYYYSFCYFADKCYSISSNRYGFVSDTNGKKIPVEVNQSEQYMITYWLYLT